MTKHLQIRELSDETHRALKMQAAAEGMSMSDYVKRLIERDLRRPDWDAIKKRMRDMPEITLNPSSTEIIREDRDSR